MDVREVVIEIEDGIAHDLPWAMVGDVAATIDREELHAFLAHAFFVQQQVRLFATLAERVYMRVFAEQEMILSWCLLHFRQNPVRDFPIDRPLEETRLQLPGLGVIDEAEVLKMDLSQCERINAEARRAGKGTLRLYLR